ncbi:hypothetical protein HML84_08850 [Alcanivorax sp. IO_7]|nr:hypothetical protein HML84_08850 [Alcanivorax sp. IO_7]
MIRDPETREHDTNLFPARARTPVRAGLAIGLFLLLTAGARAQEDAGQARFDIPAQPLPAALDSFSRQSGYQVSADAGDLAGQRSHPVNGDLTVSSALDRLLAGTGLSWYFGAGRTVVVRGPVALGDAQMLPAVKVQGDAPARAAATGPTPPPVPPPTSARRTSSASGACPWAICSRAPPACWWRRTATAVASISTFAVCRARAGCRCWWMAPARRPPSTGAMPASPAAATWTRT